MNGEILAKSQEYMQENETRVTIASIKLLGYREKEIQHEVQEKC